MDSQAPPVVSWWQYMIYHIYKDGDIVVETDNIDFVKNYILENKECSVRDASTGKKVEME